MSDYDHRLDRIDDRLDKLESALNSEVKESAEFRGEIRQFTMGIKEYVKSVSAKAGEAKEALDIHEKDPDAHGAGVNRDNSVKFLGWATILSGVFGGAIGSAVHKLFTGK